jgi:flagellar hook-associated protein 2
MKAFVDAYNTVVDTVRSKLSEKPVANAATSADAAVGSLYGDIGLNSVLSSLRQSISNPMAGASTALPGFAALGISTGSASSTINQDAVAGKLTFDESKLDDALDADPLAVRKLLGGVTGTNGLGQRLESLIDPIAGTGGSLAGRITNSDSALSRLKRQLADFDDRLTTKEAALQRQYAALESALNAARTRSSDIAGLSNNVIGYEN